MNHKEQNDENEKNAMRAFLQRSEVRLSTMHRIAGIFLNGAGLLVLFPIFFKDSYFIFFKNLLVFDDLDWSIASPLLLIVAIILSLYLILLALYNLIKDLVLFYFNGHIPGYKDIFNPRIALSSISFPPDESEKFKKLIKEKQYEKDIASFVIPPYKKESAYFLKIYRKHKEKIIPETRRGDIDEKNELLIKYLTALGLSGYYDRTLVEEVAKMETSLVKHNLSLRRLVLRYIKALLLFISTAILTFFSISILSSNLFNPFWVISITYILWGVFVPFIVKLPIDWIYETASRDEIKTESIENDQALVDFENKVKQFSWGWVTGITALSMIVQGIYLLLK